MGAADKMSTGLASLADDFESPHVPQHCSRLVEVSKLASSRVGVGLTMRDSRIAIANVSAASPLEGLCFPGDFVNLPSPDDATSLRSAGPTTADALSAIFFASSHLIISVETPPALTSARSVFLTIGDDDLLDIKVVQDSQTGRARISKLEPRCQPDTKDLEAANTVSGDALATGDLIVAISEGGILHDVANAKDARDKLRSVRRGMIEIRVVRPVVDNRQTSTTTSGPASAQHRPPCSTAAASPTPSFLSLFQSPSSSAPWSAKSIWALADVVSPKSLYAEPPMSGSEHANDHGFCDRERVGPSNAQSGHS